MQLKSSGGYLWTFKLILSKIPREFLVENLWSYYRISEIYEWSRESL